MKILELKAENIKNLKVIELTPDGNTNILTGKNGAGKSAILDALFMALTGTKLEKPIREGKERAEVDIDLGDYKIRKVFTANGDRLEVLSPDGAKYPSPQALLDKLMGDLTFDPLAFKNKDKKTQRNLLAELVGLDLTDLNAERDSLAAERTLKNREYKSSESVLASMETPEPNLPDKELSMQAGIDEVKVLNDKRKQYDAYLAEQARCEVNVGNFQRDKSNIENKIISLQSEIEELKKRIPVIDKQIKKIEQEKSQLIEPEHISDLDVIGANGKLKSIEHENIKIRHAISYNVAKQKSEVLKIELSDIDAQINKIELAKKERIINCKFPIEDLAIDDDMVLYQGQPFSQLSTGQQIRLSTAIAMALNPQLKIILIREGSLLDKEGLKALIDFAKEKDFQLWLEKVGDEKGVGIYIEDGQIVDIAKQPNLL
jgi:DNA repair exonuclease SbcCD ATPase subunit